MSNTTTLSGRRLTNIGVRRWRVSPRLDGARRPKLSAARVIARNRLLPGVVVWVRVSFKECDEYKIRPAVVVGYRGRNVTLLPCTSAESRHRRADRYIELEHLEIAGLGRATSVGRTPVVVDLLDVLDVAGELSDTDAERVRVYLVEAALQLSSASRGGRVRDWDPR